MVISLSCLFTDFVVGDEMNLQVAFGDRTRTLNKNKVRFCIGAIRYWGGLTDLEEGMRKFSRGHPIFTAAVGPFRLLEQSVHVFTCHTRC